MFRIKHLCWTYIPPIKCNEKDENLKKIVFTKRFYFSCFFLCRNVPLYVPSEKTPIASKRTKKKTEYSREYFNLKPSDPYPCCVCIKRRVWFFLYMPYTYVYLLCNKTVWYKIYCISFNHFTFKYLFVYIFRDNFQWI